MRKGEKVLRLHIKDSSSNGEVFVRGLVGPKNINHQLNQILTLMDSLKGEMAGE